MVRNRLRARLGPIIEITRVLRGPLLVRALGE